MASKPSQNQVANQLSAPQHYLPPTARELRAQAVERLQVGLFGLAGMLLLVALANIFIDRARLSEAAAGGDPVAIEQAKDSAKSDPLADIGVVPAADASPEQTDAPAN